jgi:hypothetical protein
MCVRCLSDPVGKCSMSFLDLIPNSIKYLKMRMGNLFMNISASRIYHDSWSLRDFGYEDHRGT